MCREFIFRWSTFCIRSYLNRGIENNCDNDDDSDDFGNRDFGKWKERLEVVVPMVLYCITFLKVTYDVETRIGDLIREMKKIFFMICLLAKNGSKDQPDK